MMSSSSQDPAMATDPPVRRPACHLLHPRPLPALRRHRPPPAQSLPSVALTARSIKPCLVGRSPYGRRSCRGPGVYAGLLRSRWTSCARLGVSRRQIMQHRYRWREYIRYVSHNSKSQSPAPLLLSSTGTATNHRSLRPPCPLARRRESCVPARLLLGCLPTPASPLRISS
ncbi:hypothetical protein DFH06DRAFT_1203997, partial [Mycena polygramma]